jgi:S-adenosylmethionine synthetase
MSAISNLIVELLYDSSAGSWPVEIVERKGLGHPDTICDMVSERFSVALSRQYFELCGSILHHNVDKALLVGGKAAPAFGGGDVIQPIDIYLSGRAILEVLGKRVPIEQLAQAAARDWFAEHFHALDFDRHVRLQCLVRPGSADLVDVFRRKEQQHEMPLANDTSYGIGFAPLSELEKLVLAVEHRLNRTETKRAFPASGQDIKIMGVREGDQFNLTIAVAFIDRFIPDLKSYVDAKSRIALLAKDAARTVSSKPVHILINTADDLERGAIYLTVTGTSGESGDDGETGRGNRMNGLITPLRPMSLEAAAGKNPVSHVGKLYNAAAQRIAGTLTKQLAKVVEAECLLVSRIGAPIDQPQTILVRIRTADGRLDRSLRDEVDHIVARQLTGIGRLWRDFLNGAIPVC